MRKPPSQSGQSLLQLMIVIAIMGIMGILVARLSGKVSMEWLTQQLQSRMDFTGETTRRILSSQMRAASAASVVISRQSTGQPVNSMISWIDADGTSRTVYQSADKLYAANWTTDRATLVNVQTLLRESLLSFVAYYPNLKDPSKIGYSLVLSKQVVNVSSPTSPRYKAPLTMVVNAELELKNP